MKTLRILWILVLIVGLTLTVCEQAQAQVALDLLPKVDEAKLALGSSPTGVHFEVIHLNFVDAWDIVSLFGGSTAAPRSGSNMNNTGFGGIAGVRVFGGNTGGNGLFGNNTNNGINNGANPATGFSRVGASIPALPTNGPTPNSRIMGR